MNRIFPIIALVFIVSYVYGGELKPCRLIFKDSTELFGFAKMPNMMDKSIGFSSGINEEIKYFPSSELTDLLFYLDSSQVHYQRILTYKGYNNKKINKAKSWLKVLKNDYMSLYYGFEPGMSSPSMNMWYCKKANDSIAYFISMKYSGGLVLTIGKNSGFEKNASYYFGDYKELSESIMNSEFKFEDIELVVDKYNEWNNKKDKIGRAHV